MWLALPMNPSCRSLITNRKFPALWFQLILHAIRTIQVSSTQEGKLSYKLGDKLLQEQPGFGPSGEPFWQVDKQTEFFGPYIHYGLRGSWMMFIRYGGGYYSVNDEFVASGTFCCLPYVLAAFLFAGSQAGRSALPYIRKKGLGPVKLSGARGSPKCSPWSPGKSQGIPGITEKLWLFALHSGRHGRSQEVFSSSQVVFRRPQPLTGYCAKSCYPCHILSIPQRITLYYAKSCNSCHVLSILQRSSENKCSITCI